MKKNKLPIIFGTGKQTRDFTYVEDTCEGIKLCDQNKNAVGDVFNIGQGKETSIIQIATIMKKKFEVITGRKLKKGYEFRNKRKGDVMRHLADISHAQKKLGYKPKVTFDEGVEKYLNWKLNKNIK